MVISRVASDPPEPWHFEQTNSERRLTRHTLATLYNVACNIGMLSTREGGRVGGGHGTLHEGANVAESLRVL